MIMSVATPDLSLADDAFRKSHHFSLADTVFAQGVHGHKPGMVDDPPDARNIKQFFSK